MRLKHQGTDAFEVEQCSEGSCYRDSGAVVQPTPQAKNIDAVADYCIQHTDQQELQ